MTLSLQAAYCDVRLQELMTPVTYSFACGQDISAMSATAKVRPSLSSATVIVTLSSPADITLGTDGTLAVTFSTAHFTTLLAALGTADGVWDVLLTPAVGTPQIVASGPISCTRTVSR